MTFEEYNQYLIDEPFIQEREKVQRLFYFIKIEEYLKDKGLEIKKDISDLIDPLLEVTKHTESKIFDEIDMLLIENT